jgi:hypothetical protein
MVQLTAYINRTLYDKAPKKGFYKPRTLGGKQSRRVAMLWVSTADSLCKRLLAKGGRDALYDFASEVVEGPTVRFPEDANEYCSEYVAQKAIGFVKQQVCPARELGP